MRVDQQIDDFGALAHVLDGLGIARDQFQRIGRDRRLRQLLECPRTGGNLRRGLV